VTLTRQPWTASARGSAAYWGSAERSGTDTNGRTRARVGRAGTRLTYVAVRALEREGGREAVSAKTENTLLQVASETITGLHLRAGYTLHSYSDLY